MKVVAHGVSVAVAVAAVAYAGHLPMLVLPQPIVVGLMWTAFVLSGLVVSGRGGERRWWEPATIGAIGAVICALIVGLPQSLAACGEVAVFVALAALSTTLGSRLPRPRAVNQARVSGRGSGPAATAVLATALALAAEGAVATSEAIVAPGWLGVALAPLWEWAGSEYETLGRPWHDGLLALSLVALVLVPAAKGRAFSALAEGKTTRRLGRLLGWAALALYLAQSALAGSAGWIGSLPGLIDLHLPLAPGLREPLRLLILVSVAWLLTLEQGGDHADRAADDRVGSSYDRGLAVVVLGLLLAQASLGATQRWWDAGLVYHLVLGTSLVLPAVMHLGFRSWLVDSMPEALRRSGGAVAVLLLIQGVLGGALAVPGLLRALPASGVLLLSLAVAHLWTGSLLLVVATWHATRQWPPRSTRPTLRVL